MSLEELRSFANLVAEAVEIGAGCSEVKTTRWKEGINWYLAAHSLLLSSATELI